MSRITARHPQAVARRDPGVLASRLRGGAGPMKHRCAPRAGAVNWRALLDPADAPDLADAPDPAESGAPEPVPDERAYAL